MKNLFLLFSLLTLSVGMWAEEPANAEFVDLGLPSGIKWATFNIGATSPEEYGDYFAWGETESKQDYGPLTYKYYKDSSYTTVDKDGSEITEYYGGYTKYVRREHASTYGFNGFYDDIIALDPEDDAAHVNWGGNWRMPTLAEIQELKANCTWEWVTLQGVNGYKVIGSNGNWIFLPASGCCLGSSPYHVNSDGHYLSSSLNENYSCYACILIFDLDIVGWTGYSRSYGQPVRPIYDSSLTPSPISVVYIDENGTVHGSKFIRDGQLFIVREGMTFNAQGQIIQLKN